MYTIYKLSVQGVQHCVLHNPSRSTGHMGQDLGWEQTHVVSEHSSTSGPIRRLHNCIEGDVAGQRKGGSRGPSRAGGTLDSCFPKD
jgi:hypothetical protein